MSIDPIIYTKKISSTIDQYNLKDSKYWNNGELSEVRKYIKDYYLKNQNFTCPYCRQKIIVSHNAAWDVDHIIPKDVYPQFMFEPENLCVSCKDCNNIKRNKSVLKNKARKTFTNKSIDYKIIHPHFDNYHEHMTVLKSELFFIPKDDKGKDTIEVCGLLRFLYKFSNYGNTPLEIKVKVANLTKKLLDTSDPVEEHFILSCLEDLAEKGKKISKELAI